MNGPSEIRSINTSRTRQALTDMLAKATTAKEQGHPRAEQFQAQYDSLKAEVDSNLH